MQNRVGICGSTGTAGDTAGNFENSSGNSKNPLVNAKTSVSNTPCISTVRLDLAGS